MRQDGVEVRPLREMTGRALFKEVFLDEARVPHANVIGDIADGWRVADTTPMVERSGIGGHTLAPPIAALPGPLAVYPRISAGPSHHLLPPITTGAAGTGRGRLPT